MKLYGYVAFSLLLLANVQALSFKLLDSAGVSIELIGIGLIALFVQHRRNVQYRILNRKSKS